MYKKFNSAKLRAFPISDVLQRKKKIKPLMPAFVLETAFLQREWNQFFTESNWKSSIKAANLDLGSRLYVLRTAPVLFVSSARRRWSSASRHWSWHPVSQRWFQRFV